MGARMKTGIAPTRAADAEDNSLKTAVAGESPKRRTNSQKEPVPSASLSRGKQKAREIVEFDADESSESRIAKMAQRKYEESAAIDAAVTMGFRGIGQGPLKGEAMQRKLRTAMNPELWDELIVRVAEGESFYKICADDHMPARYTAYRWLNADATRAREYEAAMLLQADKRAEQIVELSEHARERAAMGASPEEVNAIKTLINSLQWVAARINSKKWGDKQQVDLNAKVTLTEPQVDMRLAALVAKAKAAKAGVSE